MMAIRKPFAYELSVSARDDGTLAAMYVCFSGKPVRYTKEIVGGTVMADFDKDDNLVGLEILAPVKLDQLVKQIKRSERPAFRRFVTRAAPREFLLTSRKWAVHHRGNTPETVIAAAPPSRQRQKDTMQRTVARATRPSPFANRP